MYVKIFTQIVAGLFTLSYSYGQKDTTITKVWENEPVGNVIKHLEAQTGLEIFHRIPTNAFYVTLSVDKVPYRQVLDTIFRPHGYKWDVKTNSIGINPSNEKIYKLSGQVINDKNEPLAHATVEMKGVIKLVANDSGFFLIRHKKENATLSVSHASYDLVKMEIKAEDTFVRVQLPSKNSLKAVEKYGRRRKLVSYSISTFPELQTGPAFKIGEGQGKWPPARNVNGLINNIPLPILTNPNPNLDWGEPFIRIGTRVTIFGYTSPLVIFNNHIYTGDFNNINANDVIEISVLKDAVSTAKYGVRAGNGVIVIKTRTGSYNKVPKVWLTLNATVGLKPDLFQLPYMTSSEYISTTKLLYQHGYIQELYQRNPAALISPDADIMRKLEYNLISPAEAEAQLTVLANTDIRREIMRELYRKSQLLQVHAGVEGGDSTYQYYFSLGYAVNKFHLIGNDDRQVSINLDNTFHLGKKGPELNFNFYLTQNTLYKHDIEYNRFMYPFERLRDENGNALAVTQTVRQAYKDSLALSPLQDWNFKPLDEINFANNKQISYAFILTTGLKYRLNPRTELNLSYRYEADIRELTNLYSIRTYLNRNLVNMYSQISPSGSVIRAIPLGDIEDKNTYNRQASNVNALVNYDAIKTEFSTLALNGGVEAWYSKSRNKMLRVYDKLSNGTFASIDYTIPHPLFHEPTTLSTIPQVDSHKDTVEFFYSYFGNAAYTYKKRFTVSLSARKDESNIFGARANQKGMPFISTGFSYDISQEPYFKSRLFSQLQLRFSYGSCGNINRSFSALPGIMAIGINPWSVPMSSINNAPNPQLSPEKVRIANIGLDFVLLNNKIWGSAEYYEKESTNLLGVAPNDPTSGVPVFRGNVASMKGHGFELLLNLKIGNKNFQWLSSLQASMARDKVTKYFMPESPNYTYSDPRFINPVVNKPLLSVYSLSFAGLDPQTGDPIGILDSSASKNYSELLLSRNFSNIVYHGPATPTFYGSFRNLFTWRRFGLGFTLSWKDGYYFRRTSIKYDDLFTGKSIGHSDITRRWQQPGDERFTNIPSLTLPSDNARDHFFGYSSALVERGDHIRLQEIRFSYSILKNRLGKTISPTMEAYVVANNVGLLYRANRYGIDPDFANGVPTPLQLTVGVKIGF